MVSRTRASFRGSRRRKTEPSKPRPDHVGKNPQRALRHLVTAGEVVRREQEDVIDAGFLACLQEPLGTTLGRSEQPERIGDSTGLALGYRRRVMRLAKLEARLREPAQIRRAGIVEERLTGSEPAPHPSRS